MNESTLNLSTVTDDELKRELVRRKEQRYQLALEERTAQVYLWYDKIGALLNLIDHSKTTCSDANPMNIRSCSRCILLKFKNSGYWDSDYVLDISLRRSPIEKET